MGALSIPPVPRIPRMKWPAVLIAVTVSAYWFNVGAMLFRIRRKSRGAVGLVPEQAFERYLWLIWVPLVALWVALPWLAVSRTGSPLGVPAFALSGEAWPWIRALAAVLGAL